MNQPNPSFIYWVRKYPEDMQIIATAAKRMLKEIEPKRWHQPYNYVCTQLPRYISKGFSPYLLTLLGDEFCRMNCNDLNLGNAFLNNFIDNRTYLCAPIGVLPEGIKCGRKNAYINYRIMWLHFLVNMGELYS